MQMQIDEKAFAKVVAAMKRYYGDDEVTGISEEGIRKVVEDGLRHYESGDKGYLPHSEKSGSAWRAYKRFAGLQ